MWKKQDEAMGVQPDFDSSQKPDLASLGDALVESLMNDQFKKGPSTVLPETVLGEHHNQPLSPPIMKTYTEAVNEFTRSATAFIEHLPLLTKARGAYQEAMRASAEMHKVLDAGQENLRILMTKLEQGVSIPPVEPVPDKKSPEPTKVERMRGTDAGGGRATRWP